MQDTRRGWQGLVILAAWLLAGTCHALEVKDDRGHVVQLAKPPQRVISLLPSLTESVCALGACDRLVAVDKWSNWPRPVQQLPKSGRVRGRGWPWCLGAGGRVWIRPTLEGYATQSIQVSDLLPAEVAPNRPKMVPPRARAWCGLRRWRRAGTSGSRR